MSWVCPRCKKEFKHAKQAHSCTVVDVEKHFEGKVPCVRAAFDRLMRNPVQSYIQAKAATTFISIRARKDHLIGEFLLKDEVNYYPNFKTFRYSKNRVAHLTMLGTPKDVTKQLLRWLKQSYELVNQ